VGEGQSCRFPTTLDPGYYYMDDGPNPAPLGVPETLNLWGYKTLISGTLGGAGFFPPTVIIKVPSASINYP